MNILEDEPLYGWQYNCITADLKLKQGMPAKKQTIEHVKTDLEIDEELRLHEKGWVIQRVGQVIVVLVILGGALGLFGEGLFSKKTPHMGNVNVEYERFFRYQTEMKINVTSTEHISTISFPQAYLEKFKLIRFMPEPESNSTAGNETIYSFLPRENHIVSIYLETQNYGNISGLMKINGKDPIQLQHFIYP
jgi:hypothetical protein